VLAAATPSLSKCLLSWPLAAFRSMSMLFAARIEESKADNMLVMDLLAAGAAISLAGTSSLPSSAAIWARAVAALVLA
jgi:hypothetical protein